MLCFFFMWSLGDILFSCADLCSVGLPLSPRGEPLSVTYQCPVRDLLFSCADLCHVSLPLSPRCEPLWGILQRTLPTRLRWRADVLFSCAEFGLWWGHILGWGAALCCVGLPLSPRGEPLSVTDLCPLRDVLLSCADIVLS